MFSRRYLLSAGLASLWLGPAYASKFIGRVLVEWNENDRFMTLKEKFEFVDPAGRHWPVPAGTEVDGASIPRVFWSLVGDPFGGRYRAASVVHDYYCVVRTRKYQDVHQVFYQGMIASGVRRRRAWVMYKAVEKFGPRWPEPNIPIECEVVDDDYDFDKCSQNSSPPKMSMIKVTKVEIGALIEEVRGSSDDVDIRELERIAQSIN